MKFFGAKKSFTLVEMIIVVTIIAILSTIGFGTYNNFRDRFSFEGQFQQLYNYLSEARELAFSGAKINGYNYEFIELIFENLNEGQYVGFRKEGETFVPDNFETFPIDDRFELSFYEVDTQDILTPTIYIYYSSNEKGVSLRSDDGEHQSILLLFRDKEIASRQKAIYLNSQGGAPQILEGEDLANIL